jgi:arginyl-tRNA synthetase
MASTNSQLFAGLPPLPNVPGTEPERIVLDAFRIAVADQVAKCLNLDIAKVFEGVQFGSKGFDCNVAIPRFRLKEDAKKLAQKVVDEVSNVSRATSLGRRCF